LPLRLSVLPRVLTRFCVWVRPRARSLFRRRWKTLLAAAATAGLIYAVFWVLVPQSYISISPGPAPDVATLVEPTGGGLRDESPVSGRMLLTTVLAASATPAELWRAYTDPLVELWPRRALVPDGMDDETYYHWGLAAMDESQAVAAWQAWIFLGHETDLTTDGCRVYFVSPRSPARAMVEAGDVVIAWSLGEGEGKAVTPDLFEQGVVDAFVSRSSAAAERPAVLHLEINRDGTPVRVEFALGAGDLVTYPFLGLALGAEDPRTDPAVPVSFPPGDIGGPSGGLMLALQIIDDFSPVDLTGGRVVTGSGTIGPKGRVGPVGGITKKMYAAARSGATVFLVPEEDYAEGLTAAADLGLGDLELIPVMTLEEAYQALLSLTGQNAADYNSADLPPLEGLESAWVVGR